MSTKKINYLLNHYKSSYGINEKDEELRKLRERDHGMRLLKEFVKSQLIALLLHMRNGLMQKLIWNKMNNQ